MTTVCCAKCICYWELQPTGFPTNGQVHPNIHDQAYRPWRTNATNCWIIQKFSTNGQHMYINIHIVIYDFHICVTCSRELLLGPYAVLVGSAWTIVDLGGCVRRLVSHWTHQCRSTEVLHNVGHIRVDHCRRLWPKASRQLPKKHLREVWTRTAPCEDKIWQGHMQQINIQAMLYTLLYGYTSGQSVHGGRLEDLWAAHTCKKTSMHKQKN